jgi:hypothetical protein
MARIGSQLRVPYGHGFICGSVCDGSEANIMSGNPFDDSVVKILDECIENKSFAVALRILAKVKRTFPRYEEYRAKVFEARKEVE